MVSLKKKNQAYEILKNYKGDNPYILMIYRDVYVNKEMDAFGDFQVEYILKNHGFEPVVIDKIVKIADWYGEKKQKDWGIDFVPKKLKILTLIGETETTYCCYVQYRLSVESRICFLPKKAVLTNFLVEDYNKREVDFDRYDRLSDFKRCLFPHQKTAVKFLLTRKKCILADDMGLGKTSAVSVAAIEGNFDSILVICPASLKSNWKTELSFYVPDRDITVIDGFNDKSKEELEMFLGYAAGKSGLTKTELLKECKDTGKWKFNRFVILNYDILDEFYKLPANRSKEAQEAMLENSPLLQYIHNRKSLVICDEAHTLSNTKSNRYKIIRSLINKGIPDSLYLITGTPITNNPTNLYCVLQLLGDSITDDWEYYMKRYAGAIEICTPKDKEKRNKLSADYIKSVGKKTWYELDQEEKDILAEIIKKNCKMMLVPKEATNLEELRDRISHLYLRRTKEELTLPPKTVHEVYYDLSMSQLMEYNRLWEEYETYQTNENPDKVLNEDLMSGGIYRRYLSNEMVPNTIKLADSFIANGEKVVIACCYDKELYDLKEYYGDRCVIYNGKMSLKQKDDAIVKFRSDDNVKVFIGNIESAGVGITLVVAQKLIFNNMSFVPSDNDQMCDRIYRIGQTKPVDIYFQIFKDTQYQHMWEITMKKRYIIDTVIKKEDEKQ